MNQHVNLRFLPDQMPQLEAAFEAAKKYDPASTPTHVARAAVAYTLQRLSAAELGRLAAGLPLDENPATTPPTAEPMPPLPAPAAHGTRAPWAVAGLAVLISLAAAGLAVLRPEPALPVPSANPTRAIVALNARVTKLETDSKQYRDDFASIDNLFDNVIAVSKKRDQQIKKLVDDVSKLTQKAE